MKLVEIEKPNYYLEICLNQLKKLHLISNNLKIDLILYTHHRGLGWQEIVDKNHYNIYLNAGLFKKNFAEKIIEDTIYCTLYHELCHCLQYEYCFQKDYCLYNKDAKQLLCDNEAKQELVYNYIFYNNGHTQLWYKFADIISAEINFTFKIQPVITNKFKELLFKQGVIVEKIDIKIIKNSDGTYAIPCVPLEDNLPEDVTIEDIVEGRVNLSEYMATPLTIEEALKELQKIKEDKMKGKN